MAVVGFDSQVLIWGIKKQSGPSQKDMIEKATLLIEQCQEDEDDIVIPAVVLTEIICNESLQRGQKIYQAFNRHFSIIPYVGNASLIHAKIWQEQEEMRNELRKEGVPRQTIKSDILILATLISTKCDIFYTEDKALYKLAEKYLDVRTVSDIYISSNDIPF